MTRISQPPGVRGFVSGPGALATHGLITSTTPVTAAPYIPGGADWDLICNTLWQWAVNGSALPESQVVWAQQDGPRPVAPAVTLRISNLAETGCVWTDIEPNPLTFADKTISAVDFGADTLTITGHSFATGDGPVRVSSTGTLPGNLLADTDYWVIVLDANRIQLAAKYSNTGGGQGAGNLATPINIASTGSGVIKINATADTVRAGEEIIEVARCYLRVTLEMHCHAPPGVGMLMATSILQRIRTRSGWTKQIDLLGSANIGFTESDRVRAIMGTRDSALFEPRAYLDAHFCIPVAEAYALTIIESADIIDGFTNRKIHAPSVK